jgi:hypothetical protein
MKIPPERIVIARFYWYGVSGKFGLPRRQIYNVQLRSRAHGRLTILSCSSKSVLKNVEAYKLRSNGMGDLTDGSQFQDNASPGIVTNNGN